MKTKTIKTITVVLVFYLLLSLLAPGIIKPSIIKSNAQTTESTWTFIDTSPYSIDTVGEQVGSLQGQPFAGWYTDTAAVDPDTSTIAVAWIRWDADSYDNDYIYLALFKPVDADGDGSPETYRKIIKYVWKTGAIKSLDSIVIGDGKILITWTYYDSTDKNNVRGALFDINGNYLWGGDIRSTTAYEEYSRACYVPGYNSGNGGFLIIWYTSYDDSIDGKWLYYDSTSGWTLTLPFDIAGTNNLYYTKADQMLCIGGSSKALVVYRVWDGTEYYPDLYAALVNTDNTVTVIKLYDYDGSEETVGVRGAYYGGYFVVPLLSGSYVKYQVVSESDGSIVATEGLTSNGEHPYVIALSDRFVIAWIDKYYDSNGDPKVANIDPSTWDYYYKVIDTTTDYAKHPLIGYGSSKLIYVWTGGASTTDYSIKYAEIDLGTTPDTIPSVISSGTLIDWSRNQVARGLGVLGDQEFIVAFTDTQDYDEDLLAYVSLPDTEDVYTITLYELPADSTSYKQKIIDLIDYATSEIYIAVAFWDEGENPCSTPGTIAYELVNKKSTSPSIDIKVILDNDTHNDIVKQCLLDNGISVIDDSNAVDENHIMHDKFMIVDGSKLIVSTVNFITDDFDKNNNTALYIESKSIAYFYRQEFLQMWNNGNGLFGTSKTEDYSFIAFTTYTVDTTSRDIVFEGYFAPQSYGDLSRIPSIIHGYINRSTNNVYFASYIFTISGWVTPIYDAIIASQKREIKIRGVFDEEMNVDSPGKRLYWFIDNQTPVAIDIHPYKMHAKLFVIDNETGILGSWNPTRTATLVHDENILVIRDPDTETGFAKQLADYILSMYNDDDGFVRSPYQYNPPHPVITKVMFYPDDTGQPTLEWVELFNPTDQSIDLSNYVIGDSEDLIDGDDEGLYKFPEGATIPAQGYIVVAYSASDFQNEYGFKPTYEIAGTDPTVPDLAPYDTEKFTGSWNLDDSGDEVILAEDSNGFLIVVDAAWWGNTPYMETSIGRPNSADPLDITGITPGQGIVDNNLVDPVTYPYVDAVVMSDKYSIQSNPQPIPEPWIISMIMLLILAVVLAIKIKR